MSDAPFFLDPENGPLVVAEGPAKLAPGHFLKHYAPLNSYPLGDWLKIALLNLIPAIFIACFLLIKENPPASTYASALPIACLRGYLCSSTFLFIATFVNRARLDSENEKYHRLMAGGQLLEAKVLKAFLCGDSDDHNQCFSIIVDYQDPTGVKRRLQGTCSVDGRQTPQPGTAMWLVYESPNNTRLL